jgi:hypothetical protein
LADSNKQRKKYSLLDKNVRIKYKRTPARLSL